MRLLRSLLRNAAPPPRPPPPPTGSWGAPPPQARPAPVEVSSVDGFQGRENEAVIISLVRSNTSGEIGFLLDTRRMNVALTRPRRKLIVVGDSSTIGGNSFYERMLQYAEAVDGYHSVWEEMD